MEKRNTILLVLIFIIGFLLGVVLALFVGDAQHDSNIDGNNNNQINNNDNNTSENDNENQSSNNSLTNEIKQNGYNYEVTLNEDSLNLDEIVKWNENDIISDTVKYANVSIFGKDFSIQINNLPANSNCAQETKSKELLINEKVVLSYDYEGCYLVNFHSIFILNNKYIGIYYGGESLEKNIVVYDKNGNTVYENDKVIEFNINDYSFKSYEENDKNRILNTYELEVVSDKISEKMRTKGDKSFCDMICAEGLPCC